MRWGSDGGRGEQSAHVLDDDPLRLQRVDGLGHVRPQARTGAGLQARLLAGRAHVLAGKPADEDVHRLDLVPVDGGDVAQVRRVRPVMGEQLGYWLVDLGRPDGLGVEGVLDGEVEAAVPAEQRPDPKPGQVIVGVVHEGSP
ncbi:MAG: hypothetical protein L0L67_00090 [Bifidobacterium crudilactis]|nr:hypothetical protein [Bifidobacterium crudilactis]MDN6815283.1 hypothetical protein [Bifidobacterium crudilactis]